MVLAASRWQAFTEITITMTQETKTMTFFPVLLEPSQLQDALSEPSLVLIDVRAADQYQAGHLPGALRLEYASILKQSPPIGGLLPDANAFNAIVQQLGIRKDSHVVCYDAEGGAAASRMIWTLNAYGFTNASLLNGGIHAWVAEGLALEEGTITAEPSSTLLEKSGDAVIDVETLMQRLDTAEKPGLLDARTPAEFTGESNRATHGGRIPGAAHFEWTDAIDKHNAYRLLPDDTLNTMLSDRGFHKDQDVVVYCQTHHRSALSYLMLKHLGYTVTALDGAWSNWGNRDDTPKSTG